MMRRSVTGAALARTVNVDPSLISRLRNGTRVTVSDETAALIAEALGVGLDTLSAEASNVIVVQQQTPRPCGLERVNGR
jgi:transcriptional regulator with XRE-family HTH domain